jgi:hypothetical protein
MILLSRRHIKKRVSDFQIRAQYDPKTVIKKNNWEYILIHPMADEHKLLHQLQIKPDDCTYVDAYWKVNKDVFFLSVCSGAITHSVPGLYISLSKSKGAPFWINLFAIVPERAICSAVFERVQKEFYPLIVSGEVYKVED